MHGKRQADPLGMLLATHIDALPIACCFLGNHAILALQALKVSIIHLVLLLCHVCVCLYRLVAA
jgi:hypothetical protein